MPRMQITSKHITIPSIYINMIWSVSLLNDQVPTGCQCRELNPKKTRREFSSNEQMLSGYWVVSAVCMPLTLSTHLLTNRCQYLATARSPPHQRMGSPQNCYDYLWEYKWMHRWNHKSLNSYFTSICLLGT